MLSRRDEAAARDVAFVLISLASVLAAGAAVRAEEKPGTAGSAPAVEPRHQSIPITVDSIPVFNARTGAIYSPIADDGDGDLRGNCPQVIRTYSTANFTPGVQQQIALQAGMVEGEILAASYVVARSEMPLRLDTSEFIIGTQNSNVQTTTHYTFFAWEGTPNNGLVIAQFNTVDDFLQPAVLPPGTAALLVQVAVDPGDPEQIYIREFDEDNNLLPHCNATTCTFSVGFRIDQHNNPPTSSCAGGFLPAMCCPPPNNSNAFPSTDTANPSNPNFPQNNWLYCLPGCTVFGIGCGDGWHRFDQMDQDLQPGGDWNLRASYTSLACQVGACCDTIAGTCEFLTGAECLDAGGNFQGDNTACDPNPCPQPVGACCGPTGGCADGYAENDCNNASGTFHGVGSLCEAVSCPTGACCRPQGCLDTNSVYCATLPSGQYQGDGSDCATGTCPEFNQACCFDEDPPTCSDIVPSTCAVFGGEPQGAGAVCATTNCFPTGACCMPIGSCTDGQSIDECAGAGGSYRGDGTACATQSCPQPLGACCVGTNCAELLQTQCMPIPNSTWRGAFTTCPDACLPHGACCMAAGNCVEDQTSAACTGGGGTYRGNNSVCAGQNCPQPTGACCNAGSCSAIPEAQCSGAWQGAGTTCPGSCPTTGACCSYGQCMQVTQNDCDGFICDVADYLPPSFLGCYGDADGNGTVNPGDRGFVSANIGRTEPVLVCLYDLDGNGTINAGDRGFVSANINVCSPLRDFQNGSGMNSGVPDTRFQPPTFFGAGSTCGGVTCP